MFDAIPVQVWLLILIGLFTWPAWMVAHRRITKPQIDHSRPTAKQGAVAIAALVVAAGLAVFIFTPQAKEFAHSPQFLPLLMIPVAGFGAYVTIQGFLTGRVEPLSRGSLGPYSRLEQPRRYWASQIWNVTMSVLMIWLLFKIRGIAMKLGRLNHIGVATPSIADSIAFYRDVMGATKIHEPFDLPEQGVKVCFVDTPGADGSAGTQIELIEPLRGNASIQSFLDKNPQGGQHHVCYEVPEIHAAKAWFESQGKRVLGEPRIGAHGTPIFFVHPRDMQGVLTEIMETPKVAH